MVKSLKEVYELHKNILKSNNTEFIDSITDIDMAKQIIKMLISDMKRIHMETVIRNGVFEENS